MKHLHAVYFDKTTFGMGVETNTEAYREFKKAVREEIILGILGIPVSILTVPAQNLAAIMQEAHWIVSERKGIDKFKIEGLFQDEEVYVKYKDPFNINDRR
ncbi:hypothetical protein SAMN02910327_00405 [Peptostreptococcaceae bacterium pGA-8]|nr:hypothetical protein SAMN02910327_00405 [Peptostreptococcaceae bacterium pGA-8]